jgi:hypothetical protein
VPFDLGSYELFWVQLAMNDTVEDGVLSYFVVWLFCQSHSYHEYFCTLKLVPSIATFGSCSFSMGISFDLSQYKMLFSFQGVVGNFLSLPCGKMHCPLQ